MRPHTSTECLAGLRRASSSDRLEGLSINPVALSLRRPSPSSPSVSNEQAFLCLIAAESISLFLFLVLFLCFSAASFGLNNRVVYYIVFIPCLVLVCLKSSFLWFKKELLNSLFLFLFLLCLSQRSFLWFKKESCLLTGFYSLSCFVCLRFPSFGLRNTVVKIHRRRNMILLLIALDSMTVHPLFYSIAGSGMMKQHAA